MIKKNLLKLALRKISTISQIFELCRESFADSKKIYIINFGHDFTIDTTILLKVT
jgi:hypothetical protein